MSGLSASPEFPLEQDRLRLVDFSPDRSMSVGRPLRFKLELGVEISDFAGLGGAVNALPRLPLRSFLPSICFSLTGVPVEFPRPLLAPLPFGVLVSKSLTGDSQFGLKGKKNTECTKL